MESMPRTATSRPALINQDEAMAELAEADELLREFHDEETQTLFPNVYDKRVREIELSAGVIMRKVAGVDQDPNLTEPDTSKFQRFRSYYRKLSAGESFEPEENKEFTLLTNDLYDHVLQNAAAIVCTTAGAASPKVQNAIFKHARVLIMDESAHEIEANTYPIFLGFARRADGTLMEEGSILRLQVRHSGQRTTRSAHRIP